MYVSLAQSPLGGGMGGGGAHCNKEQAGPATTGGPAVRTRYCPLSCYLPHLEVEFLS